MNNNEENDNNVTLLYKFKSFIKRNSIRLKAGAAATLVAGTIGIAAWNLNKDDNTELPDPTNSLEQVDPTYNPDEDDNQTIIIPGPGPSETVTPNDSEDENNHQEENTTDEKENETIKPSQTPTGETETPSQTHEHKFSEWTPYSDLTETRTCECGVTQLQTHKFDTTKTYEASVDDTHIVKKTEKCNSCVFEQTITTQENCNYKINNFDDEFEYKTCRDCGKEVKHEHKLDEGVLNDDGTTTYTCLNKGCEYVKVKEKEITPPITEEHVHNYADLSVSYIDLNDNQHMKVTKKECTEEGCTNPVLEIKSDPTSHIYKTGVNGIDKETGKPIITYTCKDCGHEKVVERTHQGPTNPVEHTHNFNGEAEISYEQTDNGHVKVYTYTCIDPNCPNVNEKKVVKSDEVKHNYDKEKGTLSEDGKSMIYSCECGDKITEEITKPPVVEHKYVETGEERTIYDENGHQKVKVLKCSVEGCTEHLEKTENVGEKVGHSYTKTSETTDPETGITTITYTCTTEGCNHTKTETETKKPEPSHEFVKVGEKTIYDKDGHQLMDIYKCPIEGCTEHPNEDLRPNGEKVEHSYTKTSETTDPETGITTITSTCSCGHTKTETKNPEVNDPEKIDIASLITIDKTTFTYNGTDQHPTISGLPEGVTANYESTSGVNAGEYTWHITFTTPDGYTADPIDINYTIEPADVSLNYKYENGQVIATYSNILEDDIVSKNYTINGEDVGSSATLDAGIQKVESTIEIAQEKLGNYNFSEDLNQSVTYNVKNQNNWFELDANYDIDDNGTITLSIYLSNDKLPYYEDCIWPSVDFSIYFDNEQLTCEDYTYNDEFWDGGAIELDFPHDKEDGIKDGSFYRLEDMEERITGPIKVCSLTFTINEGHEDDKDIIITIDDKEMSAGRIDDEIDFAFTSGATSYIINPSGNIKEVTRDNDIMADATHTYEDFDPDDERITELVENGKYLLQEYINNGYNIPIEDEEYYNNVHRDDYEDYYWGTEDEDNYEDNFSDEFEIIETEDGEEETIEEETGEEDNLESTETGEEETTPETTEETDTESTDETGTEEVTEDTETQGIEEGQSYEFEIEAIEEPETTNEDDSPKTYQKTL